MFVNTRPFQMEYGIMSYVQNRRAMKRFIIPIHTWFWPQILGMINIIGREESALNNKYLAFFGKFNDPPAYPHCEGKIIIFFDMVRNDNLSFVYYIWILRIIFKYFARESATVVFVLRLLKRVTLHMNCSWLSYCSVLYTISVNSFRRPF